MSTGTSKFKYHFSNTANSYVNSSGWITYTFPQNIDYGYEAKKTEKYKIVQQKVQVGTQTGYECSKCKDFYPMAELNQPDGADEFDHFTCYSCRKGLSTLY